MKKNKKYWIATSIFINTLFFNYSVQCVEYDWPKFGSNIIGENIIHTVQEGEHLELIAKKYNVVFLSLLAINPDIDPYLPTPGTQVLVPRQIILPKVDYKDIVINLPELRLYYFDTKMKKIHVFPIGIGRIGRDTPVMTTHISQKRKNPVWTPTKATREEYLNERDIVLPLKVPAGPDNPLGSHALRLAYGSGVYLIHGTNKDFGVGLRVSAGCIRMRPEDISWMYNQAKINDQVRVINDAIKLSYEPDGAVYIEVHRPLSRNEDEANLRLINPVDPNIVEWLEANKLNTARYRAALVIQSGIPIEIGTTP